MRTPIVFIHRGLSSYLWCSLWQCHLRNPDNEIVLIGDRDPHLSFVRFEPLSRHSARVREFRKFYVHASTNDPEFERFCFERWFLLESFLEQHAPERFVHADSDLLFFCEVNQYFERLGGVEFGVGRINAWSPHLMLVNNPGVISRICDMMIDMYKDAELFHYFYGTLARHRARGEPGGLCDMSTLSYFIETGCATHYELNQIVDGTVFDHSMKAKQLADKTEHFRMTGRWKESRLENGNLYFTDLDGSQVRALTGHYQGGAKELMRGHTQSPPFRIRFEYRLARLREWTNQKLRTAAPWRRHYMTGAAKAARMILFGRHSGRS